MPRTLQFRFHVLWSIGLLTIVAGCGDAGGAGQGATGGGPNPGGFKIDWGSGSVEIGQDGSVEVEAPGVEVKRKSGEGVSVKAPNVDVNVSPETGVQVDAPNVNVDVQPGERVQVEAPGVNFDSRAGQDTGVRQ